MDGRGIRIGKASEQTGASIDAIRFYEKQHLLDRASRTEGGFRIFRAHDIRRIRFIRMAQQLGFSLREIRELIVLQRDPTETCIHVREILKAKVSTVREKIRELNSLERELRRKLRACNAQLKLSGDAHEGGCPVLRAIALGSNDD